MVTLSRTPWSLILPVLTALAAPTTVPSAASFYVPSLPGLKQDPNQPSIHIWSGHLLSDPNPSAPPTKDVLSHLFFLLIKARRSADKERLIFWLNGGPGCSSFDGLMMEVGPWRVDGQGGLKMITGGWDEYSNIVFVDQPAGTGLSYASTDRYLTELTDVAKHFVQFMRNFYDTFPEFKNVETYIAGESFAGQFIPYIANEVLETFQEVPLAGIAIGNGWIDARTQYPAYIEFALQVGLFKEGSEAHRKSKDKMAQCQTELDKLNTEPVSVGVCEDVMGVVLEPFEREIDGKEMCMNMYDIRLSDTSPACGMNWPPDLVEVTPYLGRTDVVNALHAGSKQEAWQECSGRVGSVLRNRDSPSSITLMPKLAEKIRVLLFAGDQDVICNYVGQERLIEKLEWRGAKGMQGAEPQRWVVNGTDAGTWQEARGLSYVKVFQASHMVGFDLPVVSHDMVLRFMNVDFTKLTDGSVRIPSAVGDNLKPSVEFNGGGDGSNGVHVPTAAEDKARWDAYYNAGTAALVFVLIALAIGLFLYFRSKQTAKRMGTYAEVNGDAEESIPLNRSHAEIEESRRRKGKGRATEADYRDEAEAETVFEIGSDGEEKYPS